MRKGISFAYVVMLVCLIWGCGGDEIIARGGNFLLTVDDLRFEIRQLGPYARYDETYETRKAVVHNLAARTFLAEEAVRRGYGVEDVEAVAKEAEAAAVGEAYHAWKIERIASDPPRIRTKPWQEKLDRKLHLKEMIFAVYPIAEEVLETMRAGDDFDALAADLSEREDVQVHDLGWVIWKDLGRETANIVFRLDRGVASDIVPGPDGYHLFYVADDEHFGLSIELLSIRSKRFVEAMERQRLIDEEMEDLARLYNVSYRQQGLAAGLQCFRMSFSGSRPPDSLMTYVVATHAAGEVLVADLFNLYYAMQMSSRPYVGDYQALQDFAMQIMLPELEALAGYDMGLNRLREAAWASRHAREEFLVTLMEDDFRSQIEVSDQDLSDYYRDRRDEIKTSGSYRISRILVDSQDDAREALRQIGAGLDFAQVAQEMSQDQHSAVRGGDLGEITFGMVAVYDSVVRSLSPGQISQPFETLSGIEIIKVEDVTDPRQLTFEEAQESIRRFITNTRANELLAEWVNDKKDEVGFRIDEELLERVALPQPEYRQRERESRKGGLPGTSE